MRPRTLALLLLLFLGVVNLTVLLDVPVARIVFGSVFLTVVPGLLISRALKLDGVPLLPAVLMMPGLSYAFLMFYGLLLNTLALGAGYLTPLAPLPVLLSLDFATIVLGVIAYLRNRDAVTPFAGSFRFSNNEKVALIAALVFPYLSIFGADLMNRSDSNALLMVMLLTIPVYVIAIVALPRHITSRVYPPIIFAISLALLMMFALRSSGIIGADVHSEFLVFRTTVANGYWSRLGAMDIGISPFDSVLSISILPAIYNSMLNLDQTIFYKVFYSLAFSISPLAVYAISRRYVSDLLAFLAALVFMSYNVFIWTAANPRTSMAILFLALAFMALFCDELGRIRKSLLVIVFTASVIVSHYSTAYAYFFLVLIGWLITTLLTRWYRNERMISFGFVALFACLVFLWYGQLTGGAFSSGVGFFVSTLQNLYMGYFLEAKGGAVPQVLGVGFAGLAYARQIHIIVAWAVVFCIGIGTLEMLVNFASRVLRHQVGQMKQGLLRSTLDIEYFALVLAACLLMVFVVLVPTGGIGIERFYVQEMVILSLMFVVGCGTLSCVLSRLPWSGRCMLTDWRANASVIILLIWIPYFMAGTGMLYQVFGIPQEITLNSKGSLYDDYYIRSEEIKSANWLMNYSGIERRVYTDDNGGLPFRDVLGLTSDFSVIKLAPSKLNDVTGYIYLRHHTTVDGVWFASRQRLGLGEYQSMLSAKNKLYDNGGSAIYR